MTREDTCLLPPYLLLEYTSICSNFSLFFIVKRDFQSNQWKTSADKGNNNFGYEIHRSIYRELESQHL